MTERQDGDGVPRPRAFRLLSHAYRRALVDCLDGCDGGLALADAAAEVARRNGCSREAVSLDDAEDVYVVLYHCHLPRLVEAGVVAHDRARNVVSLTDRGERLADARGLVADPESDPVVLPER